MMPPGVLPPKIKKEVKRELQKEQTDAIKKEVERQKADPQAQLKKIEMDMGLTPTSTFLTSQKPRERAKQKISDDGDDDGDEGDDKDDKEPL
jgi:hypothetical protein